MEFTKYEPIPANTTVWEVGSMLEKGEKLLSNCQGVKHPMRVYGCVIQYRHDGVWCGMAVSLSNLIKSGDILREVKVDWKDTLNGTIRNGIWCLVKNITQSKGFIKLVTSTANETFVAKITNFQVQSRWDLAEPVPSYLADALDKYYNIERTNNECNKVRLESSTSIDCYV